MTAIQAHAKEHKIPLEWHLDNENLDRLNLIARPAEVAIVFISASSGEGYITVEDNFGDRNNMEAWGNGAALVKAVCEVNKNVIVVIHSVSLRLSTSDQQAYVQIGRTYTARRVHRSPECQGLSPRRMSRTRSWKCCSGCPLWQIQPIWSSTLHDRQERGGLWYEIDLREGW